MVLHTAPSFFPLLSPYLVLLFSLSALPHLVIYLFGSFTHTERNFPNATLAEAWPGESQELLPVLLSGLSSAAFHVH